MTVSHTLTGLYLVNFGQDITHCAAVANQGGVPVFSFPGSSTPAAQGNGVRVDINSAGSTFGPGFPTADTVTVSTFSATAAANSSFFVAVLC